MLLTNDSFWIGSQDNWMFCSLSVHCERLFLKLGKSPPIQLSTAVDNFVCNYFPCLSQPFN
jgi:hypothetical protein